MINKDKVYNFLHLFTLITEIFREKSLVRNLFKLKKAYPKSGPETRDFWWDPRPGTLILHGTIDPTPRTLKERPGTPMIGETGDPKLTSLVNQM